MFAQPPSIEIEPDAHVTSHGPNPGWMLETVGLYMPVHSQAQHSTVQVSRL